MSIIEVILPILVLAGMLWFISKNSFMRNGPFSVRSLQFAFLLRISFGFMLFLLYTYYYPVRQDADTFKYFDDSKYMYDALWTNPGDYFQMLFGINCETEYFQSNYFDHMSNWVRSYDNGLFNDNRLVIRINALMRIFSFGSYHVHSIILSYLAFLGSFYLSRVFYDISRAKIITYFSVFMVPSLVFWSSGILKEAVLLFALGVFAYHFYQLLKRNYHTKHVVILMLMSCILIVMKLYVFAAFLPAILVWYIVNRYKAKLWVYLLSYTAFVLIALLLGQAGMRICLLDKGSPSRVQQTDLFKGKTASLNLASIDLFKKMGIWEKVDQHSKEFTNIDISS